MDEPATSSGTTTLQLGTTVSGTNDLVTGAAAGTTPTAVFTQASAATNRAGAWASANVSLNGFAGQTIRLRIEAADAATGLVEAGVDNVTITQN